MTRKVALNHWRFLSFLAAQFLGAFNDNAFKLVVSMASLSLILDPAKQQSYLAMTSALAILPFLLFSGYAGYFADRYAKSNVLRISKAAEILAMGAALLVFATGQNLSHLLITLFLLATHSAFFGPSKYGILPEIMREQDLPKANGYLNMLTFLAIIAGSMAGATLWGMYKTQPEIIGAVLTGIAVLGTILCLFVPKSTAGNAAKKFSINPLGEVIGSVRFVLHHRMLATCMVGSAVFWMLGGLIYLSLIMLGRGQLGLSETAAGSLFAFLASGIALGSVLAGYLLDRTVRRTLIVWGALILAGGCILTGLFPTSYGVVASLIGAVGIGGGLFIVPVVTLLQKHTPEERRGQLLAAVSFFDMLGVFLASGIFWLLGTQFALSASTIILAAGAIGFAGLAIAIYQTPVLLNEALESAVYFLARRIYRIRVVGAGLENGKFPQPTTPTVFIANHVTFIDGLILSMLSKKPIRYMVLSTFWKKPFTRFVLDAIGAIPFGTGNVNETRHGLDAARGAIANGEYVCIFPEGVLTRTGHLHAFKRGVEKLVAGTDTQIVPVYLERLWGSVFSFHGRRFLKKFPKAVPYPVTVNVGQPVGPDTPAWQLNQIISALGSEAIGYRYEASATLGQRFIAKAKSHPRSAMMSDMSGLRLTRRKALIGARVLSRWLEPQLATTQNIGVLMPATTGGAIVNLALALLGKTSVNLNYSLGAAAMEQAIAKAGITRIITARRVIEKLEMAATESMVFLEDARGAIRKPQQITAILQAVFYPTRLLCRRWLSGVQHKDAPAAILFSSGSTSTPKGVVLSHGNLIANIDSMHGLLEHAEGESGETFVLAGILPFFHSFGLSTCLWLPAITGRRIAYHPNPLEAKNVVRMIAKEQCSLLVATPTFARHYVATAKEGALDSLKLLILGGEKLSDSMEETLAAALPNAHVLQGYGTTELGPVVAINVPDIRHNGLVHRGYAKGSVGRPMPGVSLRIVDAETGELRAPGEDGLILVLSPSRMQGYYHDETLTAAALRDGWYVTGDIGHVDKDGFLFITDRLARFSKIGGEMVPHGKIEAAIESLVGDKNAAVVALADARKGEKLYVLIAGENHTPDALHAALKSLGLPNLWIPSADAMFAVPELPLLATGKLDLRACKRMAEALTAAIAA